MEDVVNEVHEMMKDNPDYQNLGLDERGEFCVKLAELFINYFGGKN